MILYLTIRTQKLRNKKQKKLICYFDYFALQENNNETFEYDRYIQGLLRMNLFSKQIFHFWTSSTTISVFLKIFFRNSPKTAEKGASAM